MLALLTFFLFTSSIVLATDTTTASYNNVSTTDKPQQIDTTSPTTTMGPLLTANNTDPAENWTYILPSSNRTSTVPVTLNNASLTYPIVIPLVVAGKDVQLALNTYPNGTYHLGIVSNSFDGHDILTRCAQIRDVRGKMHSVCAADREGMCTRRVTSIEDLMVNAVQIENTNQIFDLSWNCAANEQCCDYGCCPSTSSHWQITAAGLVLIVLIIIACAFLYLWFCNNREGPETGARLPAPTVSSIQIVRTTSITVISSPSNSRRTRTSHTCHPSSIHRPLIKKDQRSKAPTALPVIPSGSTSDTTKETKPTAPPFTPSLTSTKVTATNSTKTDPTQ